MFQNITPITQKYYHPECDCFHSSVMHFPQSHQYFFFPTSPYFKSWQIITHTFMHGGFMHIVFNMLTLQVLNFVLGAVFRRKEICYFIFSFWFRCFRLV